MRRLFSPKSLREVSTTLLWNFFIDAIKVRSSRSPVLKPLVFTYYITLLCNFDCAFCNFAQSGATRQRSDELNTEDSIRLLRIIRQSCSHIYFSGGEPLLRKDLGEILSECKRMGFHSVSVNTNLGMIHERMEILDHIDNLVVSFHRVDDKERAKVCQISERMARQVKENLTACIGLQKEKGFVLTVNCVITPDSIDSVREVMDFCFQNNICFEAVPAFLKDGRPDKVLMGNEAYQSLIRDMIEAKRKGYPVVGSFLYLDHILHFKDFDCYPTLIPYVNPNGDLFYPCQPIGTVATNLLVCGSYEGALREGAIKHGGLPMCRQRCYKVGYIESSLAVKHPFSFFKAL